mgnify:CR=1 FL=1|jgi:hypothetical protein
MGIVREIVGTGIGMLAQNSRAKKQHNRQKELMGIQLGNQKNLNKQGHELQMDMWNKTNYGAQKEHMLEAGLNPALMYGMSGGGGATTGSQGGGSAQGGNASAPMDIGNALQMGLMEAQIENIKADTKDKLSKVPVNHSTTNLNNAIANLKNVESNKIDEEANRLKEQTRELAIKNEINEATKDEQIKTIELNAINGAIKNALDKANKRLSDEKLREVSHEIKRKWTETGIKGIQTILNGVIGLTGAGKVGEIIGKVLGDKKKKKVIGEINTESLEKWNKNKE